MFKRQISCLLALVMILQIMMPFNAFARENKPSHTNLAKVGEVSTKDYPKIDTKLILQRNKEVARSRKHAPAQKGVALKKSDYVDGSDPSDSNKPNYFGRVTAKLNTKGLDNNPFQWGEIFGKDGAGNNNPIRIEFHQLLDDTPTGIQFSLEVDKNGTYKWQDGNGNPTLLPLYSKDFKPFKYSVFIDKGIAEKVKLITSLSAPTPSMTFEKENGKFVADIEFKIDLQQVAATNFSSVWKTDVAVGSRPQIQGNYVITEDDEEITTPFNFPKNETSRTVIRDGFLENFVPDEDNEIYALIVDELVNTPKKVEVKTDTTGLTFDTTNKTVISGDHKYKYDFTYDVINGGKLTMTEILPVTFDANGGTFTSLDATADQKIVKEVDYDNDLTEMPENPTKDRETFKGWSDTKGGTTPVKDDAFKNITKAKTFFAIWGNNDIIAEQLEVKESFKDGDTWVNDFIPTLDQLKGQVKIKDAKGDPQPLTNDDKLQILDDNGNPIADTDLKDKLYEKLKEDDTTEVSRDVTLKAKVTVNGTSQTVDIPIKVIKNIYEAKTLSERPFYVPDNYVKVTLDPTTKAQEPQKTYYYVNPDAKVVIPGSDPTGKDDNVFTKWSMKADSATGDGAEYDLSARHQFSEASTITAQYEKEKQGTIKIKYVDENGKEIDAKYKIAGQDYPSEKSGGLGRDANDTDFASTGPDFKGYIFSSRDALKGKHYKDQSEPDKLDTVEYSYFKKVTTDDKSNSPVHFKVVFDANDGSFGTDTQKTLWVYMHTGDNPVTFEEARVEIEGAYGLPTKDKAEFKEWQDKATDGTKVADDHVINVPNWDWEKYPDSGYAPETFYAHYEQAGALVKYLDLDGKAIADEFKIDGVEYPTEKTGKAGEAIASDVFTAETAPKFTGYKFNRIELNPKDGKYSLDKKATIKIYYEEVPDVIPANPDGSNPDIVPEDYVRVEFVPTDKGSIAGNKVFFVNPKKEVTIPIADPTAKATYTFKEWKMGANAEGEVYTPGSPKKFTQDTTITATYKETENIIPYDPSATDPMPRPEGYVRVTFAADPGLKLTEQKAYYVKKNASITLKAIKDDTANYGYPGVTANTGYKFDKWDKEDSLVIEAADILVTAKATKLDNVIPSKGLPNEKPDGYKEVTFVIKTEDKDKGSITGVAKFYVNPTEYVKINPPATTANTGYEFGAWDKDTTIPTVYDKDATITGSFNGLDDVIPKTKTDESEKPEGYVKVTFMPIGEGYIPTGETTVYFVNPEKEVTITPPKAKGKTGYEFNKWNQDTTTPTKYPAHTIVTANFKKLDAIIPSTDGDGKPNPKPEGYVTVTFLKGDHGELSGQTVYYVNPMAVPTKKLGDKSIVKPTVTPEIGYSFDAWSIDDKELIQDNKWPVASYKALDDVIPKTKDDDSEKPNGYITVKFSTEANGKIKDTEKREKVVYVNPNKAVKLEGFAPEVTPNTGFTFADWDTSITKAIQYEDGDVIKAKYNPIGAVIPKISEDTKKPAGYVTVTFAKGDHGELSGTTVYYVDPNKEVTVPAPTVKPTTGYEFEKWDKELTQTFTQDTKIKAEYKDRGNIIPQEKTDGSDKPGGYHTVTFKAVNGSLEGTTVYYVKPNTDIDLTNTADGITKNPNVGYTAEGGTWKPAITKQQYAKDATYTFAFVALPDVIEKTDESTTKPDGYVTVRVVPTDKATDKTEKTYYVNPTKEVTIPFAKPTGKNVPVDASNQKAYKWIFTKWTSDESPTRVWDKKIDDGFKAKFTNDTTVVTAQYEQSITDQGTVVANEVPVHESYKEGETWVNNFIPEADTLKAAVKVNDANGNEVDLPEGAKVEFVDDSGVAYTNEAALRAVLYDKLQEKANPNDEPTRVEKVKAKVTFKDGEVQNVEIPIKVIKNIYKANTDGSKPNYVPVEYVKVTVDPTTKAKDPQRTYYYVNKEAKVVIPGEDPEGIGDNKFVKWTYSDNGTETEYKLADKPRNMFTEASTITAQYVSDVIPQTGDKKPDTVPENFVSVTFNPTDNGTLDGTKIFWVNPEKEVTIPVKDPVGKQYFTFKEWKIGVKADGAVYNPSTPTKFTDVNGTTITATYDEAENIIPYDPNEPITKPDGYVRVTFAADPGLKLTEQKAYYVKKNAGITLKAIEDDTANYGYPGVTANTGYKFDKWDPTDDTVIVATDIVVTAKATELDPVIPEKDDKGNPNDKPEGYVTVTFVKGERGKELTGQAVYYVNPNKSVVLKDKAPTAVPNAGYKFAGWDVSIDQAIQYQDGTVITALYNNPSDISTKEIAGYVKVEFKPGEHGSLSGPTDYWVKPGAEVYLPSPTVQANDGYRFDKWDKSLKVKFEANAPTYVITAQYEKQKPVDPTPELRPYPVPGDCNNTCDQPNAPNQPNQPNQPNVGKDALNTTDHYQYLIGYPDGNFNPNKGMTRAEAATMFTRLLNERPIKWRHYDAGLSDIRPGDWYANTVGYAVQRGIVSGYPDGSFKPNKPITRAEFAAIASRFDALAQGNAISFSDLAPSHWGYNAIRSAATKGWISGYPDNTFRPEQAITRAEVTAITNRMLNRHADLYWIDAHPSEVIRFGDVKRSDWYFEPIMEATMGHDFIRDRDKKTEHWTGINGKSFI